MGDEEFEGLEYSVANEFIGIIYPRFNWRFNPSLLPSFVQTVNSRGFISVGNRVDLYKAGIKRGDSLDVVLDEFFRIRKISTIGPQGRVLWEREEDLLF